jgi:hypothetical protein
VYIIDMTTPQPNLPSSDPSFALQDPAVRVPLQEGSGDANPSGTGSAHDASSEEDVSVLQQKEDAFGMFVQGTVLHTALPPRAACLRESIGRIRS